VIQAHNALRRGGGGPEVFELVQGLLIDHAFFTSAWLRLGQVLRLREEG
jgi:hypothetical protein